MTLRLRVLALAVMVALALWAGAIRALAMWVAATGGYVTYGFLEFMSRGGGR